MKLSPWLPFYVDTFLDYGFNRVEHFENLRLKGASFFLLNHAFVVDIPHEE